VHFFAAQAAARRRTRRLLVAYALAVAVVVAAISWVVLATLVMLATDAYSPVPYSARMAANLDVAVFTGMIVLGVIAFASLYRSYQLRGGGGAVARALGGERVPRETADPKRRRLLNVVDEMAIASGVPVPAVYVLEQENGINAFAAGLAPTDAAIAVTRGALERLTRAELQGVIGHEFSHVLNGDMRLNTRLAGPLFGLLVIAIVARHVVEGLRGARDRRAGAFVLAALAIMVIGYLGVWLGRLLQAAICRQREFLADASSVQFTRDTTGLRDALVRIARSGAGSRVASAEGEDLAHLFIASAYDRAFATHPPLPERIRALDPRFDLDALGRLAPEPVAEVADADELLAPAPAAASSALAGGAPRALDPARVASRVGNPGLDAVRYARALREALPDDLADLLARGSTAACVWLAVGLSADAAIRARQVATVAAALGPAVADAVGRLHPRIAALPVLQRLPLLQRALPALAQLPRERRLALVALGRDLARADARIDVLEWLLGTLGARYLGEQVDGPAQGGTLGLEDAAAELGVLFAALAHHGHADDAAARRAYERGLGALLPRARPDYAAPSATGWAGALDAALARLDRLAPAAKELLVEALARCVEHDGRVEPGEAELFRATCAALHCPLPPLLAALDAHAAPDAPDAPDAGDARGAREAS
jgi:Zn-dependent protease with chaperone function